MALSSGSRSLFAEILNWVAAALVVALAVTHFEELKSVLSDAMGLSRHASAPPVEQATQQMAPLPTRPQAQVSNGREVTLSAQSNGHYVADVDINGRDIEVLVDTGATVVSLTYEDAERVGLFLSSNDFTARVRTANGTAKVAPVRLDRVEIGGITVRDVDAVVSERGRLGTTLLGMSFLSRLGRVDMRQGQLVLAE